MKGTLALMTMPAERVPEKYVNGDIVTLDGYHVDKAGGLGTFLYIEATAWQSSGECTELYIASPGNVGGKSEAAIIATADYIADRLEKDLMGRGVVVCNLVTRDVRRRA